VASRLSETDYRDSRTETFLKEATVRQLRELSRTPVLFLDGSFAFNTTASVDNYSPGHLDFPVDLYSWSGYPYIAQSASPVSARQFIVGPRPIQEVREANLVANLSAIYPGIFAWHNDTMWLSPAPTGVVTIRGDYRRDGRRDSATGNLITTTSTTATNGWFDEGENALRCAVLLEYHESISKDLTAAQLMRDQLYGSQDGKKPGLIAGLKKGRSAIKEGLMQMGETMFNEGTSVPDKRSWRWA
jgi:hypothetical protein